ncbi:MAG: hypothetical protein ACK4FV_06410 [Candidatus Nitrosocaldus sp.]
MVSAVFTESILLIASITIAAIFASTVISKSTMIQSFFATQTQMQREVALTNIKVIYVNANANSTTVKAWIKNTGMYSIYNLDAVDIYFGEINALQRIPYNSATAPKWVYDNTDTWNPKQTKEITITLSNAIEAGKTYMLKVALPNGITDEYIFST